MHNTSKAILIALRSKVKIFVLLLVVAGILFVPCQLAFSENQSFNVPKNISNSSGQSLFPKVALSGNNMYAVWSDSAAGNSEIFFARSTDGGQTFSALTNLSSDPDRSRTPSIAASNSNVYVVWSSNVGSNSEIFFARSTDGGQTFSTSDISNNAGFSYTPQLAVAGSNVYVVWNDNTSGNLDIMFARSTDGGNSFSSPVNISANPGGSYTPQLALSGSTVYIVWSDNTDGSLDILLTKSTDNGVTFTNALDLSDPLGINGAYADSPQIALYLNNVYVVWQGSSQADVSTYADALDIYLAASADGGSTFNMPLDLSNTAGQSSLPKIAASANGVYVVWNDNVGNNYEILTANNHLPTYIYSGVLQPINSDGSSIFKLGSTVPIKFQLKDSNDNYASMAIAQLHVAKVTNSIVGDQIEAISSGNANTGNLFRYDASSNQYIYNLSTKSLSKGTWQLIITLDDGTIHNSIISLK